MAPWASNPLWRFKTWPPSDPAGVPPGLKRRVSLTFDPCVCVWECVGGTKASLVFHGGGIFSKLHSESIFWPHGSSVVVMAKVLKTEGTHLCECVCKPKRWLLQEILLQQFIFKNLIKRFPTMSNTSRQGKTKWAFSLHLLRLWPYK